MTMLKSVYPLYLNNVAQQPNADLAVTDKYTGEVAFRDHSHPRHSRESGAKAGISMPFPATRPVRQVRGVTDANVRCCALRSDADQAVSSAIAF